MTDEQRAKNILVCRERHADHREEENAKSRAHHVDHREEANAKSKAYDATHREEKAARDKAYKIEHREEIAAYRKEDRIENKVRIAIQRKKLRVVHKEQIAVSYRTWVKANPEKVRLYSSKRRALELGNTPISELLTEEQWQAKLTEYNHRCAYCGCKLGYAKGDKHPTLDHVIPVSRGGKHSASNVVPSCLHCNCSKNAKTPEEWIGLGLASVETVDVVFMHGGRGGSNRARINGSEPAVGDETTNVRVLTSLWGGNG